MLIEEFRELSPRQQALVAVAVLLDGREGAAYLANDAKAGNRMEKLAVELSEQPVDLRMPLLGSLLRDVLDKEN